MCLLPPLPPKSSKSGADGFSINVHSMNGVSYPPAPQKREPRGHWLKNTQGDKFLLHVLWWLFLSVCVYLFT